MMSFKSYSFVFGISFLLGTPIGLAQTVVSYPDNSTNVEGFLQNGIPPINQVWTPDTYEKAFEVLFKIYELDKYSMPRYQSQASAPVFARLVAAENFDYLLDSNYTLKDRVVALERYAYLPDRLLAIYAEKTANYERFGGEVLEILRLTARLTSHAVLLLNELKSSIGKQADTDGFKEGYNNILKAHESAVASIINIFENSKERYPALALEDFSCTMLVFIPEVWPQLKASDREALWSRIEILSKDYPQKKIRKRLRKLRKDLKKMDKKLT
ncbi:MAG: hypothetical protein AB8G15_16920 [Saprospiraceae bacterium]